MNYKIVRAESNHKLAHVVKKMLNEGWYLFGAPFFADGRFCQALTTQKVN